MGLGTSTGSYAKDMELDTLSEMTDVGGMERGGDIPRYALEMRAVRRTGSGRAVTPLGKLIMELPDRDALRWMLAAEIVQSHGEDDEWRLSKEGAVKLLGTSEGWRHWDEDARPWPIQDEVFHRLSQMGIVKLTDQLDVDVTSYELLPQGRPLLEEITSGNDTPFMSLARAMLQDETAAVLGQFPAAAVLVRQENAVAATTRHARMVAHELRNALVPMQVGLRRLYEEIEQSGRTDLVEMRRGPIDAGIARLFQFVQDIARVADLATKPAELFELAPAIEAALAAVELETGGNVAFVREAELPNVMGHRDRFVLVVGNLLRNAAQAREAPPVRIRLTAGVNNGAEVFVRVDDDGPGVAEGDRSSVFSPGFSRRPGGSGQGLAFVREVVEPEMAGRVVYEESPLGGARFTIRLPVGTRRSA